jgi:hypothetical protein
MIRLASLFVLLALNLCGMSVAKGAFTLTDCTVPTQDVTVGFQPKAYMLFVSNSITADINTFIPHLVFEFGITDGATGAAISTDSVDNVGTSDAQRGNQTGGVVLRGRTTPNPPFPIHIDHNAFLAIGFRVNLFITRCTTNTVVHYLAWGGSDITNIKVTQHAFSTSTGNQGYSGVGFTPDFLMLYSANNTVLGGGSFDGSFSLGAAISPTKRWAFNIASREGQMMGSSVDASRYQRTDSIYLNVVNFAEDARIDLQALGQGACAVGSNFCLNQINAPAANIFFSFAIKGTTPATMFDVGSYAKCTGAGCTDTITPIMTPKMVILESFGLAATTSISADSNCSWGGFTSTAEGSLWNNQVDNIINTQADSRNSTTKAVTIAHSVAGGGVLDAEADGAIAGATFTTTWTTQDGVADQILWAAFGDGAAPSAVIRDPILPVGVLPVRR